MARLAGNIVNGSGWRKTALKLWQIMPKDVMRRLEESSARSRSDNEDADYWASEEGKRYLRVMSEESAQDG